MRIKWLIPLAAAASFALAGAASAAPGDGIANSPHDFSSKAWSGGEICAACHAPHNTDSTVTDAPLWNHEVTAATFTVYSSATLNATVGQPDGVSKLCLSCHDGTVALDSFGGQTGTSYISGNELLGTDLSNDHPISFVYNTALATADGGLNDPLADGSGVSPLVLDANSKVQCSTCHDVHNSSGETVQMPLLRETMAASAICLTCHAK